MTEGQYHFPMQVWEASEEFADVRATDSARAQVAIKDLIRQHRSSAMDDIYYFSNCVPAVWRNAGTPYYEKRHVARSEELAKESARYSGATGYFSIEALEEFAAGGGVIFDQEMHELGFRPSKVNPDAWAKRKKGEGKIEAPYRKMWRELHQGDYVEVDEEEVTRLRGIKEHNEVPIDLDSTFTVEAGKTGLVYVSLDFNPFQVRPERFGRLLAQRLHIDRSQRGFSMTARNVHLGTEKKPLDVVHIKALTDSGKEIEAVWPNRVRGEVLFDMTINFRDQAEGRRVFVSA